MKHVLLALVALTLSPSLSVSAQETCPDLAGFPPFSQCLATFREFLLSESFTSTLCSEGRSVVDCFLAYGEACPSVWETLIQDQMPLSQFRNSLAQINVSCEIWNIPSCSEAKDCFLALFGETSAVKIFHSGLSEFFAFFCGEEYLRKTETCISRAAPSCPYTVADLYSQEVTIRQSGTRITYRQMRDHVTKECMTGQTYLQTKSCLDTRSQDLLRCTVPEINVRDGLIQCNYHADTTQCINTTCGDVASEFFTQTSVFLECGVESTACPEDTDTAGVTWPVSLRDTVLSSPCPALYTGTLERLCTAAGVWEPPVSSCQQVVTLDTIQNDIVLLLEGGGDQLLFSELLENLTTLTDVSTNQSTTPSDLKTLVDIIDSLARLLEEDLVRASPTDTENFLLLFNNLVSPVNIEPWKVLILEGAGIEGVLRRVEDFLFQVQQEMCTNSQTDVQQNFTFRNVYSQVIKTTASVYVLPDRTKEQAAWLLRSDTEISIQASAFPGQPYLCVGGSYIRDISEIIAPKAVINGTVVDSAGVKDVNSAVLSLRLTVPFGTKLDPPARLVFTLFKESYTEPVCSFWDYNASAGTSGAWSSKGCAVIYYNRSHVICECDHLTNFAVLMRPADLSQTKVLNIISAVGCAISIVALLVTVFLHWFVWRLVRSDRAVILMNLCVALLLALIIFLAGVDKTQSKEACAAIAAMLHFFFLAVFCLMLVEGIEIVICVVHVFVTRFRTKYIVPVAWIIPAVIVAVSLGVTKTEGYGTSTYCWLSTENHLIYAFIGPVALVIFLNLVVIITVFWKMSRSTIIKHKSAIVKAKTSLRSLCVLLPVLGLTWAFGLLAIINDDLLVFQYLFAIVNSLQGLLIFVFHCLFNRQVRDALRAKNARRKSRESFEQSRNKSMWKNQENRNSESTTDGSPGRRYSADSGAPSRPGSYDEGGPPGGQMYMYQKRGRRDGLPPGPSRNSQLPTGARH